MADNLQISKDMLSTLFGANNEDEQNPDDGGMSSWNAAVTQPTQAAKPLDEIERLKEAIGIKPEEYRKKRLEDSWIGRHKIVGGILEAIAGFSGKPGPYGELVNRIDQDFKTQRASNELLMQTLMGEKRANLAAKKEEDSAAKDKILNEYREKEFQLKKTATEARVAEGKARTAVMDRRLTNAEAAQAVKEWFDLQNLAIKQQNADSNSESVESKTFKTRMIEEILNGADPERAAAIKEALGLMAPPPRPQQSYTITHQPNTYDAMGNLVQQGSSTKTFGTPNQNWLNNQKPRNSKGRIFK
jgi:RNase H-fold protein (predicted Holliday junction resolvase)